MQEHNVNCYTCCQKMSNFPRIKFNLFLHILSHNEHELLRGNSNLDFSDGCDGQNNNTILIAMLGKWLVIIAPNHVDRMEIIFLMVGHIHVHFSRQNFVI